MFSCILDSSRLSAGVEIKALYYMPRLLVKTPPGNRDLRLSSVTEAAFFVYISTIFRSTNLLLVFRIPAERPKYENPGRKYDE